MWADLFTEDAEYIEHAYGTFKGREKIREWITKVMAPFPSMTFPQDWVVFDEDNGAILFQCQNRLPTPPTPRGRLSSSRTGRGWSMPATASSLPKKTSTTPLVKLTKR